MDHICLALPILAGRTADARAFMRELEAERKTDYAVSERRIGITKELWYLASLPSGDQFVAYMESPDFSRAVALFSASQDPFDLWFKAQLAHVTGVDMNHIPEGFAPPELLSHYDAREHQPA